ncbi:MAG: hypothetical protein WCR55_05135 [Lentisphaerota bacterium]
MRLFSRLLFSLILVAFGASPLFSAKEYKGAVVSIGDETYSTSTGGYDRGFIITLAKLGQIGDPVVYDSNHNVVYPGTVLINGFDLAWMGMYLGQQIATTATKGLQGLAYDNYLRYKKLYQENAESQQDFEAQASNYAAAQGSYAFNVDQLAMDYQQNIMMKTRAQVEGIVKSVTQSAGSDVGSAPAIEYVWLNPIAVKVNIPREEQKVLLSSTPVKIYVKGQNEPFGIYDGFSYQAPDGSWMIQTRNFPVREWNVVLQDNGLPILREWEAVIKFDIYPGTNTLAVPDKAIQKDDKGSFVWRAKGQKAMQSDKGIDYTFPVEKVYVTVGNEIRYFTGYTKIVSLKDPGALELNDLVVAKVKDSYYTANLKDGGMVIYPQQAYLMMPGDEVRVVIGEGPVEKSKAN